MLESVSCWTVVGRPGFSLNLNPSLLDQSWPALATVELNNASRFSPHSFILPHGLDTHIGRYPHLTEGYSEALPGWVTHLHPRGVQAELTHSPG